jgi:SAM-dependent methyltransferase
MTTHAVLSANDAPLEIRDEDLTARMEPFDSFWEAPTDVEKGYRTFAKFYAANYLGHFDAARDARILVVSCGPGYMVNLLAQNGYRNVQGIDSFPDKIEWARRHDLPCQVARAFGFLRESEPWDVIFCEQEINHLTKPEILAFLGLCRQRLRRGGQLFIHAINGANPFTGSESRAGNFDHYNSFTEYSLQQVLEHTGFVEVRILPLNLYVFWRNPLNYVAFLVAKLNDLFFRAQYLLVGKSARVYTKKIGAVARTPR